MARNRSKRPMTKAQIRADAKARARVWHENRQRDGDGGRAPPPNGRPVPYGTTMATSTTSTPPPSSRPVPIALTTGMVRANGGGRPALARTTRLAESESLLGSANGRNIDNDEDDSIEGLLVRGRAAMRPHAGCCGRLEMAKAALAISVILFLGFVMARGWLAGLGAEEAIRVITGMLDTMTLVLFVVVGALITTLAVFNHDKND